MKAKRRHSRTLFDGALLPSTIRARRGSAMVMAIIVSVVVTALVMIVSWAAAGISKTTSGYARLDRAYFVAEGGAQQAYWLYKHNSSWRASAAAPLTGSATVDGHTYNYSVTCVTSGAGVLVTSSANDGYSQAQVHQTLTGGLPPSALAISGQISSTSQLILTGNIISVGKVQTSGTFNVTGNLTTGSTFGGGTVSGTTTTNASNLTVDVPTASSIYTQLASTAYTLPGNPSTISSLDFTSHPVIQVGTSAASQTTLGNGMTITGSGTLIVMGQLKTGGDVGTSTTQATLNVVTTSDFTATNNWYVTGSLYVGGNITFNNQTKVIGAIVANGNVTLNNHHTIIYATPPSFDPRGTLTASSYGGAFP